MKIPPVVIGAGSALVAGGLTVGANAWMSGLLDGHKGDSAPINPTLTFIPIGAAIGLGGMIATASKAGGVAGPIAAGAGAGMMVGALFGLALGTTPEGEPKRPAVGA